MNDQKLVHDLNNCLSSILMQAQFLALSSSSLDAEGIKKSAEAIEQSVQEMVLLLQSNET